MNFIATTLLYIKVGLIKIKHYQMTNILITLDHI